LRTEPLPPRASNGKSHPATSGRYCTIFVAQGPPDFLVLR
jgi:hypothetical protein